MSIFGKKFGESDSNPFDFTNSANQSSQQNSTQSAPPASHDRGNGKPASFSIDQAIKLVGSLKDSNVSSRVIASIIKQTLESVDIHFKDIIADARLKESSIQTETGKKDEMIKDLTRKVEALQNEKVAFQKELERTVYVREFLQQAVEEQQSGEAMARPPAGQNAANPTQPASSIN